MTETEVAGVKRPPGVPRKSKVRKLVEKWGMERAMERLGVRTITYYPEIFVMSELNRPDSSQAIS